MYLVNKASTLELSMLQVSRLTSHVKFIIYFFQLLLCLCRGFPSPTEQILVASPSLPRQFWSVIWALTGLQQQVPLSQNPSREAALCRQSVSERLFEHSPEQACLLSQVVLVPMAPHPTWKARMSNRLAFPQGSGWSKRKLAPFSLAPLLSAFAAWAINAFLRGQVAPTVLLVALP